MIDLHSHVLPAVDDGTRTVEEACELARAAAAAGVTAMAATPHVRADYPTSATRMEDGVTELRRALAAGGVPLEILPGGEVDVAWMARLPDDELRRFALAGVGYLLVEVPSAWSRGLDHVAAALRPLGLVPVFAHPERNRAVQERPERVRGLLEVGGVVQLTTASLDGRLGRTAQRTARRLLELGLAHLLASDAHGPDVREFGFAAALEQVGDDVVGRYLVDEAPAAIVAGDRLPPPPRLRRRRRWRIRV